VSKKFQESIINNYYCKSGTTRQSNLQKFMVFVQIFLTILCQACPELLQTAQKKRLRKYIRDDMKRNHPGKNKTERPRMERGKGGG